MLLAFLIVSFSQTTLHSDIEGCNWFSNMDQVMWIHPFIRSSEDENPLWNGVEWYIIHKQALNGFHGSFCFPDTSKIAWATCCVGETKFGCKLLVFMGWTCMEVYCQIQLLEVPMPIAKIDFVRDYLRRLPIQFAYLNIPGVIVNNK